MLLFVLAYFGGAFTILSPCILPVLPFVFARSGQPFVRSQLLAAADDSDMDSPETYVGYTRAENFAGPGAEVADKPHDYAAPAKLGPNQWGLAGNWTVEGEKADLGGPSGSILYRFHARDLHLVLGPGADGKPVRFRVTLDGKPLGDDHGADTDADGNGTVTGQRLYKLVRQAHGVGDHTFQIEFLDPDVQAFAFTFG